MHVYFYVAGRGVKPSDLDGDWLEDEVRATILRVRGALEAKGGDLKCPTHGEEPVAIVAGPSHNRLSLQIDGCCDEFVDTVSLLLNPPR